MDWLYLCSGLAALVLSEKDASDHCEKTLSWHLGVCLREGFEILWQSALLVAGYSLGGHYFSSVFWQKEMAMVFFWLIPYGLSRLTQRKGHLFLAIFVFCCWAVPQQAQSSSLEAVRNIIILTLFFVFFELLLTGVRRRLLFSPVPQTMAGLPVLLVSAAILSWAIGGLGHFLF